MNLQEIIDSIPCDHWLNCTNFITTNYTGYKLTVDEFEAIINQFQKFINEKKADCALNWITLGIIFDQDKCIKKMRKLGLLRSSKYEFEPNIVSSILSQILKSKLKLKLNKENRLYLKSVINLCFLSNELNFKLKKIISSLLIGKEKLLWQLLAILDKQFMIQKTKGLSGDKFLLGNEFEFFSPEELAEALSYIFYIYHSKIDTPDLINPYLDIASINCELLLIEAAHIKAFQEFEILIDIFNYRIDISNKLKQASLIPPTKELAVALEIGYIKSAMQQAAFIQRQIYKRDIPSIKDISKEFYQITKGELIEFKPEPCPRYIFKLFLVEPLKNLLGYKFFFSEEITYLAHLSTEWSISVEEIMQFEFVDGLTLKDLLLAQRLFAFIQAYIVNHFEPRLVNEKDIILQSLVPSFSYEQLVKFLHIIVGDKAEAIIKFLVWLPESQQIFDLHYQPLIKFGDYIAIPYNLLANSNLLRNALQLSRKRIYSDGNIDPLVNTLAIELRKHTSYIKCNVTYNWQIYRGEIDIIALIDGYLFIIECKNPIVPGSLRETQTSYDYIITAASQLTRLCNALHLKDFRSYLTLKLGWEIDENYKPVTCIVISNRMFVGYRLEGHAVRSSLEMISQINSGIVQMGDEKICLWQGQHFSGEDLRRYIESDTIYRPYQEAMFKTKYIFPLGDYTIHRITYSLNLKTLADNFGFIKTSQEITKYLQKSLYF